MPQSIFCTLRGVERLAPVTPQRYIRIRGTWPPVRPTR